MRAVLFYSLARLFAVRLRSLCVGGSLAQTLAFFLGSCLHCAQPQKGSSRPFGACLIPVVSAPVLGSWLAVTTDSPAALSPI